MEKLFYRPSEGAELIGVSKAKFAEMLRRGEVPSILIGGNRRIPAKAFHDWADRLIETQGGAND